LIARENKSLGWVGSSLENTADVVGSDSDVSLISPAGAPGVLDKEEVLSVEGSVSDGEDTVVEVGSASGGDDSRSVTLEGVLVGLDGDGDWLLVDGGLELSGGLGNINESSNLADSLGGNVLASSISGGVSVVGLELEWVGLDVFEGIVHQTSVATFVSVLSTSAVNELLLGVGLELSVLDEHSSLNGTGGGEGPA